MRTFSMILILCLMGAAVALEHACPEKVFGKPEAECAAYGLVPLGKDDFAQATASKDATLVLVKAGTCYTLFRDVARGAALSTWDGKRISHVTYCGGEKPEQPEPEPEPEPQPEPQPEPEPECQIAPQPEAECKKIANEDGVCTRCVTSACTECRRVVIQHCVKPTPVRDVASCVAARGGSCHKMFANNQARKEVCLKGIRVQCGLHVCKPKDPEPQPEPEPEPEPQPEPKVCPPPKPVKDVEVSVPLPKNHLRGGRQIKDKFHKMHKSLDLLAYALQLKGITVEAECVEVHEVNVDKFAFPEVKFELEKEPTPEKKEEKFIKKEKKLEKEKGDFVKKEKELIKEKAEEADIKPVFVFEETKPVVPEWKPEHPLEWYRHKCREFPSNSFLCNHELREKHEREAHAEKWAKAVLEAAAADVARLSAKQKEVHEARVQVETEIIFVNDADKTITKEEKDQLRERHVEAAAVEEQVKAALDLEIKKEKDAAEALGVDVPPLPKDKKDAHGKKQ